MARQVFGVHNLLKPRREYPDLPWTSQRPPNLPPSRADTRSRRSRPPGSGRRHPQIHRATQHDHPQGGSHHRVGRNEFEWRPRRRGTYDLQAPRRVRISGGALGHTDHQHVGSSSRICRGTECLFTLPRDRSRDIDIALGARLRSGFRLHPMTGLRQLRCATRHMESGFTCLDSYSRVQAQVLGGVVVMLFKRGFRRDGVSSRLSFDITWSEALR